MTRPPRLVLVATATFGLLTAFWSVLAPLAEAPDEPAHLGLVQHVATTGRYPAFDGLQHTEGLFQFCIDHAVSVKWCTTAEERAAHVHRRERPAAAAPPKDDRMRWDDPAFQVPKPDRLNQMPQHPPLYYYGMAAGLRVERALVPGELSVDTELAYLRLLNVLVVLPLPWLAWLLARRLGVGDEIAVVASLLPLAVPQLTHIGGTLNNDNLFMVLVSALMVPLAGVARGDRSRRTTALVGLVTGLALLTKGFGVVLPPIVVLAYWIGTPRPTAPGTAGGAGVAGLVRRGWRAARPATGALAVGLAVSGWWYVRNLATTGQVMPSIENERLSSAYRPSNFHFSIGKYLASTSSRVVEGFWGAFGWRRVELPPLLSVALTLLCGAAVYLAFRHPPRLASLGLTGSRSSSDSSARPGSVAVPTDPGPAGRAVEHRVDVAPATAGSGCAPRPVAGPHDDARVGSIATGGDGSSTAARSWLVLLLAPITALAAFVTIRAAVIYRDSGELRFQQGRYLFAGLTAAGVVVAIGLCGRLGRRALPAVVGGIVAVQGLAVLVCLSGWWGADGVPIGAVRAVVAWSGWPDPVAFALLAAAPLQVALLVRATRRRTATSAPALRPAVSATLGTDDAPQPAHELADALADH